MGQIAKSLPSISNTSLTFCSILILFSAFTKSTPSRSFSFLSLLINVCLHHRLLCTLFCGADKPLRLHQEPSKLREIILVEFICNTSPEILTCLINYRFEKDRRNFSKDNCMCFFRKIIEQTLGIHSWLTTTLHSVFNIVSRLSIAWISISQEHSRTGCVVSKSMLKLVIFAFTIESSIRNLFVNSTFGDK